MKCSYNLQTTTEPFVAPLAGAWIEISLTARGNHSRPVAPLAGAWIEINVADQISHDEKVAPLAGAWIEIL